MPAPTILKRNLEFHFPRAVSVTNQVPQSLDIIIIPLSDPSAPDQGTYVGGLQKQTVILDDDDNVVVFQLVPTNSSELLAPVTYRAAWREGGVVGRTYTYDFAMPDADVRFDELQELGQIIGGETYLQQADLGVPGRVAKLNEDGVPVDSDGHPAAGAAALDSLATSLDEEVSARAIGDAEILQSAQTYAVNQVLDLAERVADDLDEVQGNLQASINGEISARQNAVTVEAAARAAADDTLSDRIDAIDTTLGTIDGTFDAKADLDLTGRIPLSQIPPAAITNAVSVPNQAAMLALTTTQAQPGDLAVRPDGVYGLFGPDPSVLANWVPLSKVTSVNGYQGVISLTAADVGAIATGTSLPISQVTGLSTALSGKADNSTVTSLSATINAIQSDSTVVRTSGGFISHTLLDNRVAYVNPNNEITLKDGTVIASGTGNVFSVNGESGVVTLTAADVGAVAVDATFSVSDIDGLQTALDAKIGTTDARLTNARTPLSHAASHASGGSDPLTISISQVTGLSTTLGNLTTAGTTTELTGRVSSLEAQVIELAGSGGGSPVSKDVWWNAATNISGVVAPAGLKSAGVKLRSPLGLASNGTYYYDPTGAAEAEVVWPYITPNGHLELRRWDETAAADTVYAPQSALDATNTEVAKKATQVDLNTLTTVVNSKASQADVNTLQNLVDSKASTTSVNALNTTVAGLATQASVNTLTTQVSGKANQTDLLALSAAINSKASQTDVTTARNDISALQTMQTLKADLSNGKVPLAQIPINIPQSSIFALVENMASKADLVSGKLKSDQIPSIPITQVTNLTTALGAKADLVNGKLATSQLPAIATTTATAVDTRAQMLNLSQSNIGDVCIIKSGSDQGTYTYIGPDASLFTSWLLNIPPSITNTVTSINGQVGAVTLTATDIKAYPSTALIPLNRVETLETRLATFATTSALTTGLDGKTSPDSVRSIISASPQLKQSAKYVATTAISNLYGVEPRVDGSTLQAGDVVLVTAQASPVTHGLYTVVANGPWVRTTDMATGSYFVRGTMVVVTGGSLNGNTVWQLTSASGVTGNDSNNWVRVLQAGPPVGYQAGNGLTMENGFFSVKPADGIMVTPYGTGIDPTRVVRKYTGFVPSGSTLCTIKHDLDTDSPLVQVIEHSSGSAVLVGWTVTGKNTISMEFSTAVASQQWRVVVVG